MASTTGISWADSTVNPWLGCQAVSPGCDNCYAEIWAKRSGMVGWGARSARRRRILNDGDAPFSVSSDTPYPDAL